MNNTVVTTRSPDSLNEGLNDKMLSMFEQCKRMIF